MNRYHGRRFASFMVATSALMGGFFFGNAMIFGAYATSLGVLYAAYLAGQSATDWQKTKNGG